MFNYNNAFKRNLGWITKEEQEKLKNATIAIGGLGGVGGVHLETLTRLGVSNFHIADLDIFDYSNFNRQVGANVETVGKTKISVALAEMKKINPEIKITLFDKGVNEDNINEFLDGVDLYVDSLDIFAIEARKLVFRSCHKKEIPAITAAPMAMGVSFLCFSKDSMSFDDYFGLKDLDQSVLNSLQEKERSLYILNTYADNVVRFIGGVAPKAYQRHYIVDITTVDLFKKDLPSLKMGIDLAAGALCSNALKLLLGRGEVIKAPRSFHFDSYLNKYSRPWRPFGHKNPLQSILRLIIKKRIKLNDKLQKIEADIRNDVIALPENINEKDLYEVLSTLTSRLELTKVS